MKKNALLIIIFATSFLLIPEIIELAGASFGALKFVRFITPLLFIYLAIIGVNHKLDENILNSEAYKFSKSITLFYLLIAFVTLISNSLIFSFGFTYRNFVNVIFLLGPAFCFYIISQYVDIKGIRKIILFLFYGFAVLYLLSVVVKGVSPAAIVRSIFSNVITNSDRPTESVKSLLFGFFALYFLATKQYKHLIFCIVLTIMGGKRIAILGTFLAIIAFLSIHIFPRIINLLNTKWVKIIFFIFLFAVAHFWILIFSGNYDEIFSEYTGVSTDAFLMGRQNIASSFYNYLPDKSNYFIGYGIGYVENVLYYKVNYLTPFHNEHLRLYLELGAVFFVLWSFIMSKYLFKNKLSVAAFILLLCLMQTDNILMYENVMFSFYAVVFYSYYDEKLNKHDEKGEIANNEKKT